MKNGFTLIEMCIIFVILGMLFSITFPTFLKKYKKEHSYIEQPLFTKDTLNQEEIKILKEMVKEYNEIH